MSSGIWRDRARWLAKEFAEGLKGNDGLAPPPPAPERTATVGPTSVDSRRPPTLDALDAMEDPMGSLWYHVSYAAGGAQSGRLINGAFRHREAGGIVFHATEPESNVLTLGPPRSA